MKVFKIVQRQYALLGISNATKQPTQNGPFNERILFGFLLQGCALLSSILYILWEVNGFLDYMVSICTISANSLVFVCFMANVSQKTTLFACIKRIEKLIDSRENTFKLVAL